jgi:CRP-like cAMP-binding protein
VSGSKHHLWYVNGGPLPTDLIEELREAGRVHRWGHRAEITLRPNPDELVAILGGHVDLDGPSRTRLTRGDLFGELHEGSSAKLVRAYDDVQMSSIGRDAFHAIILNHDVRLNANAGAVRRRQLWVPLDRLLYTPPQQRLARVVLHLVGEHGESEGAGATLGFGLRIRALARLCGLAEPEVSDIVERLVREQIIDIGRSRFDVTDLERVRDLATD